MSLTDTEIIDNTHFQESGDRLECYTVLPGGDEFREAVPDRESVSKNMIAWCNTVREYISVKEQRAEEERVAAKARRKGGNPPETRSEPAEATITSDPKEAVLEWYRTVQEQIDALGESIKRDTEERNSLRDQRDRVEPIIKAWKGSE